MAPSTRTRKQPVRRAVHGAVQEPPMTRAGTRGNPVVLAETPEPEAPAAPARTSKRKPAARVKAAAVVKPKPPSKAQPKKKLPSAKRECSICATTKSVTHSFRLSEKPEVCKHFQDVCGLCIQKMLKTKMSERKLGEPDLACPFPKCESGLDTVVLKQVCSNKEIVAQYEQALVKHHLSANPNYIVCLSSTCGVYFSIEDCQGKSRSTAKRTTKHKIECPNCDYEICLTCNRPWHDSTSCDKAKQKEDADSVAEIKTMGAKPCPKCGLNIDKDGGCDHMTCRTCRHNFCWECLVPYHDRMQHAQGCRHGRRDVAIDPRNWVQDNMTDAQINALIAEAHGPQVQTRGFGAFPTQAPNPAPLPLPNGGPLANAGPVFGEHAQPPFPPPPHHAAWFPGGGGFGFGGNFFNTIFGGGNGGNA